mmetsp:Transcript_22747/g.60973  ORF Transcript_22747/g.60973 Transcript_22747/m.60973 type:complete len:251 (-) Transcript_22747:233-985(-)
MTVVDSEPCKVITAQRAERVERGHGTRLRSVRIDVDEDGVRRLDAIDRVGWWTRCIECVEHSLRQEIQLRRRADQNGDCIDCRRLPRLSMHTLTACGPIQRTAAIDANRTKLGEWQCNVLPTQQRHALRSCAACGATGRRRIVGCRGLVGGSHRTAQSVVFRVHAPSWARAKELGCNLRFCCARAKGVHHSPTAAQVVHDAVARRETGADDEQCARSCWKLGAPVRDERQSLALDAELSRPPPGAGGKHE